MESKKIGQVIVNGKMEDIYIDVEYFHDHVEKDHGIKLGLLKDMLHRMSLTIPAEGFRAGSCQIDCGIVVGKNHLVETTAADHVVKFARGKRGDLSNMVPFRAAEDTTKLNMAAGYPLEPEYEGKLFVYTVYTGKNGEREPNDRMSPEERAVSEAFWSCHALVPTDDQLQQMKAAGLI